MSIRKYNQNSLCIRQYNHNYTMSPINLKTTSLEFKVKQTEFKLSESLSNEQGVSSQDSQIEKELFCLECLLTQENVKRRTNFLLFILKPNRSPCKFQLYIRQGSIR